MRDAPYICSCDPRNWDPKAGIDPITKSMQPPCIADAHFRGREMARLIREVTPEDRLKKYFRCLYSLIQELKPGHDGAHYASPLRGRVRACTFLYLRALAIGISERPDTTSLYPPEASVSPKNG